MKLAHALQPSMMRAAFHDAVVLVLRTQLPGKDALGASGLGAERLAREGVWALAGDAKEGLDAVDDLVKVGGLAAATTVISVTHHSWFFRYDLAALDYEKRREWKARSNRAKRTRKCSTQK